MLDNFLCSYFQATNIGFIWGCGTLNASVEYSVVNHLHGAVQVSARVPNT